MLLSIVLMGVALAIGCDNSFEPLKENNLYNYSMYGVLDQSADTQWVRVMPLRTTILRGPISNDANVFMIRENDGQAVQLQDTLMQLAQNTYVWNFWTDVALNSEYTYTIQAISPEQEKTSATANIPPDFGNPEISYDSRTERCFVDIKGDVEHLVVAEITYTFRVLYDGEPSGFQHYSISSLNEIEELFGGIKRFEVYNLSEITRVYGVSENQIIDLSGELLVVSADSNWYDFNKDAAEIPGKYSNVKNGLGLVTGVVSKRLPYRPNVPGQENLTFCPPR